MRGNDFTAKDTKGAKKRLKIETQRTPRSAKNARFFQDIHLMRIVVTTSVVLNLLDKIVVTTSGVPNLSDKIVVTTSVVLNRFLAQKVSLGYNSACKNGRVAQLVRAHGSHP